MAEPDVEVMPAQILPRTPEEAYWRKELAYAYPRRRAGPMWRSRARFCARQLRAWRRHHRKDSG